MLKDLQNEKDDRNIFISNIGICDYKLPISIQFGRNVYSSICNISSNVALSKDSRGAHLSRIIEVLNDNLYNKVITLKDFNKIMIITKEKCETIGVDLTISFDIILKRLSPISKKQSFVTTNLEINNKYLNSKEEKSIAISMIGTMLCPCSKEIAKYGAHNQKCKAKVILYGNYEEGNLDEIINIMEN